MILAFLVVAGASMYAGYEIFARALSCRTAMGAVRVMLGLVIYAAGAGLLGASIGLIAS